MLAQGPDTLWTRTYGGTGADAAYSMIKGIEGNYIITGFSQNSPSNYRNLFILNIDSNGDTIWTKTYGGSLTDEGVDIHQTSDGGYIIIGNTESFGSGLTDIWLLRTDNAGDTVWTKTYGDSNQDVANSGYLSSDGGVIISGSKSHPNANGYDGWLLKTDNLGDTLWTEHYGLTQWGAFEYGTSVIETTDGNILWTTKDLYVGTGYASAFLSKYDNQGSLLWRNGHDVEGEEQFNSVIETFDKGFILTGWRISAFNNGIDLWLVRTDSIGDTLWTKSYGGSDTDVGYDLIQTADNGFIVTGYTRSYGAGNKDLWVIRTDSLGDSLWTRTYGGEGIDEGYSILQTEDGGYIISGNTTSYGSGSYDIWVIKLSEDLISVNKNPINLARKIQLEQNYANPFNPITTIEYSLPKSGEVTLIVYNLLGDEVARLVDGFQPAGEYNTTWNASNIASGIYFYRLKAGDFVQTRKMVLLK